MSRVLRRALRRLGPVWQVQRRRHPRAAAAAEAAALGAAGRARLLDEVRRLRRGLGELQRDHLLLAAHVATLTERVGAGAPGAPADDDAARQRARLAAVAFYEQRIADLEDRVRSGRRARGTRRSASIRRPSGEHGGTDA